MRKLAMATISAAAAVVMPLGMASQAFAADPRTGDNLSLATVTPGGTRSEEPNSCEPIDIEIVENGEHSGCEDWIAMESVPYPER